MSAPTPVVNNSAKPGPKNRWMARAAADLNVTLPHLYLVATHQRVSRRLAERIKQWKAQQKSEQKAG